jgi:hypothetical protein
MLCSTDDSENLDEVQVGTQRRPAKLYRQMEMQRVNAGAQCLAAGVVSVLMLAPTGPTGQSASDRSDTHWEDRKGSGSDEYGSEAEI